MKKKGIVILIVAVLCLVVAIAGGILLVRRSAPLKIDVSHGGPSTGNTGNPPEVITRTLTEDTPAYSIQVEYPELQGVTGSGIQDKVNNAIKTAIFDQVASFHEQNAPTSTASSTDPVQQSTFNANFTVALVTDSFFSGLIAYSDFSAGAAHPNNYLSTLDYNLKTGDMVTLDQILKELNPSGDQLDSLSQLAQKDLIRQFGDDPEEADLINTGAAPTAENYQYFTLDRQGLNVVFDPYQVAPGSAGAPKVSITYDHLTPDANSTSSTLWWLE